MHWIRCSPLPYLRRTVVSVIWLSVALAPALRAQNVVEDRLSPAQRAWLAAHPAVTLGIYNKGWPPLETFADGRPSGMAYEYLNMATRRLGLSVHTKSFNTWSELMRAACRGEIDVVMNVSLSAERTQCLVFTRSYLNVPTALAVSRDALEAGQSPDLKGLRLITENGFVTGEMAAERYPLARHMTAPDTPSALQAVHEKRADAYLGEPNTTQHVMVERGYSDLVLMRAYNLPADSLHFGVVNAQQPLAEALDVALAAIPAEEFRLTRERWLRPLEWGASLAPRFTPQERAVLAQGLNAAIPLEGEPLSFLDPRGRPSGLINDYLARFKSAGANITPVPVQDWGQVREMMKNGKVDVVFGIPIESSAQEGWEFSAPFLSVSNVIVARQGSEGIMDLRDLEGRRVAVSARQRLTPVIKAHAPHAKIVATANAHQALAAVSEGRADAFVGNLAIVDHLLRTEFSGRLAVVAPAHLVDQTAVAVRADHAPLVTAFNKMLYSMPQREREALQSDWISVQYRSGIDVRTLLQWLVPCLLVLLTAGIFHSLGYCRVRKEVRQRRQAEQKLDEVTSNLPAVVYQAVLDPAGELSVPFIVGDITSMFGISAEEAMVSEAALFARVHPEDQPLLRGAIEDSAAFAVPIDIQFRALSSAHSWRWIRTRALPHSTPTGALHWNGYWVDVSTLHEQAQALTVAKSQAEAAAAAKSDFLAMMSHEIRTPMAGILGMLQILNNSGLNNEQHRVLSVVDDSANMLRQILDDILDFSKMEAGAVALHPVPMSLRAVIENVVLLFRPQAEAKGVTLEYQADADVAAYHLADATRLRQIFFNLISNALKFSSTGRILVDVAVSSSDVQAQVLAISVSDEGSGIPLAQQARLFRPFVQADQPQGQTSGTGLGLSICKRLVELMGGEISLWSEPCVGTRVDMLLPAAIADAAPQEVQSTGQGVAPLRGRVLVVEDNPTNQELLRWQMDQLKLDATLIDNGKRALEELAEGHFDLVLTDCRMPGMDGYQLAQAIRQREQAIGLSSRLPIIALTASALADEARRCSEAGMDGCLTKPITLEQLHSALSNWLPMNIIPGPSIGDVVPTKSPFPSRAWLAKKFGSDAVAGRLIESLSESLQEDLEQLKAAVQRGDTHTLGERAHRMAGALGTVSATELAEQARNLSTHALETRSVPSQDLTDFVSTVYRFLEFLQTQRNARSMPPGGAIP